MKKKLFIIFPALVSVFSLCNVHSRDYSKDIYSYRKNELKVYNKEDKIYKCYERGNEKKRGIDVSKWQGKVNWELVKQNKVEFAMIREGYGVKSPSQKDSFFAHNVTQAHKNGIGCGVYHYSYADNEYEAEAEAEFCLENINGYKFEYPVVFDIEENKIKDLGKNKITDICKAFCNKIRKKGYYVGIYTNLDWVKNFLNSDNLFSEYDLWLARYNSWGPGYTCGIWQHTSSGRVNGIEGNVDCDICYFDYPRMMKELKLNGF